MVPKAASPRPRYAGRGLAVARPRGQQPGRRAGCLLALVALAVAGATGPDALASRLTQISCDLTTEGSQAVFRDGRGQATRLLVAYRRRGGDPRFIATWQRAGRRYRFDYDCEEVLPPGISRRDFGRADIHVALGDRSDRARLNRAPRRDRRHFGALPPFIDATVRGGVGSDAVFGHSGTDILRGGPGGDRIKGDGGDDILSGGAGGDRLVGGAGNDLLRGGAGGDVLDSADGSADVVRCGPGRDRVRADRRDTVKACEEIWYAR